MLQAHVSAAKAAIDALFRVMAVEYGPFGVRANVVAPGGVENTEGLARLLPKAALDRARRSVPLGYAEVVDIENACLFRESSPSRVCWSVEEELTGGLGCSVLAGGAEGDGDDHGGGWGRTAHGVADDDPRLPERPARHQGVQGAHGRKALGSWGGE